MKGKHYSFRLHPDIPEENDAIIILEALKKDGFNIRQIMTDAILTAGGKRPEMYHRNNAPVIESMFSQILDRLANMPFTSQDATDTRRDIDAGNFSTRERNLLEGLMQRRAQKGQG